ncbi:TIGR02391 family protein [Dactylosporangium sp. CS-047395]|uniref:TIGR02391 family protein n=1 Tax=Dactylosporangium sp. CS-047395 TaxID=3239936 RepID=UPI003D89F420
MEAFDWVHHHGLFARDPEQSGDCYFITRLGQQVLDATDGLAFVRAQQRLGVDLHPRIGERVRAQFLLGEYELAAFAASREVEIRVRELAAAGDSDIGVKLTRQAFAGGCPQADPALDGSAHDAVSTLFAGALGVFKNPAHTGRSPTPTRL